ncbi:hypothetical protein SCUCBS95973_004160 [Sporothrix curviconia]|uniref:Coatomer subunit epsilon n=1 Tax=Sporothrix curviconia TaxID=1260050 RepID=A0ABP0BLC3_9PEZI
MDPYSAEGELINIHNHFHQGQYQDVADYDISSLSPENSLAARVLQLRARVELGEAKAVLADVKGESDPALQAVGALAEQRAGRTDAAVATITKLAESAGDNAAVQIVGATVLQAAGKSEEALALVSKHDSNLDAVALIVQIHLQQNRNDLALKEVVSARRWAQDSLLVNLTESWVGLRLGGERYQQAFYVFEELAQAPASSSVRSLVAQAVSELHLGRTEEAQAALKQAVKADPEAADVAANLLVLTILTGKDTTEATANLQSIDAQHALLVDLEEKSDLFDKAAAKYQAKVSA